MASTRVANDDSRLRRAQALAPGTITGLEIARYLVGIKLAGQAAIAREDLSALDVGNSIEHLARKVAESASLEETRNLEASAASFYWSCWEKVEATFVKTDAPRVPDNWRVFEGRRSAVDPVLPGIPLTRSMPFNYLFRLVEVEAHLATVAVGLDPGLGSSTPMPGGAPASYSTSWRQPVLLLSDMSSGCSGPNPSDEERLPRSTDMGSYGYCPR